MTGLKYMVHTKVGHISVVLPHEFPYYVEIQGFLHLNKLLLKHCRNW